MTGGRYPHFGKFFNQGGEAARLWSTMNPTKSGCAQAPRPVCRWVVHGWPTGAGLRPTWSRSGQQSARRDERHCLQCVVSPHRLRCGKIAGMAYAILRIQKLKSPVAVMRSLKHAFREQDTPNADLERTPDNEHFGASSVRDAMSAFRARLPERFRKDAVQCVEYLMTASPEAMKGKSREQQDAYFADSLDWLKARHGAENVFYAGVHRDETTLTCTPISCPGWAKSSTPGRFLAGQKP